MTFAPVLLVFGLVFFILSAFRIPEPSRFNFTAAGLACWISYVILLGHIR